MTKALIYCRTSTDKQELGLDKQSNKLNELADAQGYEIVDEYSTHISGMKEILNISAESQYDRIKTPFIDLEARPEIKKIFMRCQDAGIDKLLIYDPSRLARRMRTSLILEDLFEEIGVDIEYYDVSDSWIGKQVSALIYEKQVRDIRENTRSSLETKKENDEWLGRPPTGFKTVEEHNKLETSEIMDDLMMMYRERKKNPDLSRTQVIHVNKHLLESDEEEITASKVRSLEKNIEEDKPKPKYVKGDRPY